MLLLRAQALLFPVLDHEGVLSKLKEEDDDDHDEGPRPPRCDAGPRPRCGGGGGPVVPKPQKTMEALKKYRPSPEARGGTETCCICLDLLPLDASLRTYYACCSQICCGVCVDKCETLLRDPRCPVCRRRTATTNGDLLRRMLDRVEKDDPVAQRQLASAYRDGDCGLAKNAFVAVQLFDMAARQGDAAAQGCLGYCFYAGAGVPKNAAHAAHYFDLAAAQGDFQAQSNLASLLFHGAKGVPVDSERAANLWRKAAEQGDPKAMASLGRCHATGLGAPYDLGAALGYYARAYENGVSEVLDDMVRIEIHMDDDGGDGGPAFPSPVVADAPLIRPPFAREHRNRRASRV